MEQSSTPWRVFDAPAANEGGSGAAAGAPTGGPPGGSTPARVTNERLALVGVLGAVVIGAVAVVIAVSGSGSQTIDGPGAIVAAGASADPESAPGDIVVDVAGAVVTPGVYHLAVGARVGDAIEAAGGFSPRVDVDRVGAEINLAATLADGAQIRVPSRDDVAAGGGSGGSAGEGGAGGGGSGGSGGGQVVNLNTATQAELETLSGIGPVTAGKILESRAGAPFKTVDELRERGLVGEKTFEKIRALLTVN